MPLQRRRSFCPLQSSLLGATHRSPFREVAGNGANQYVTFSVFWELVLQLRRFQIQFQYSTGHTAKMLRELFPSGLPLLAQPFSLNPFLQKGQRRYQYRLAEVRRLRLEQFSSSLIVNVLLAIFTRASAQQLHRCSQIHA